MEKIDFRVEHEQHDENGHWYNFSIIVDGKILDTVILDATSHEGDVTGDIDGAFKINADSFELTREDNKIKNINSLKKEIKNNWDRVKKNLLNELKEIKTKVVHDIKILEGM